MHTKVFLLLWLLLLIPGCSDSPDHNNAGEFQKPASSVRLTLGSQLDSLDTARATNTTSFSLIDHLQEGLLRYGPEGDLVPGLAESWSQDGLQYTFVLRRDIVWQDGSSVTAHDFVYAWRRLVNPETASLYAFFMEPIKNARRVTAGEMPIESLGVSALSDRIFLVELERPTAYFLEVVAFSLLTPVKKAFVEAVGASRYFQSPVTSLSSGPYRVKEFVQGARLILEKNKTYWRSNEIQIDELRYEHFTSDPLAQLNLFRANQIDYTTLNDETVKQAAALNLKIQFHPTGQNAMIIFNVRPDRPTGNLALRQAFQAAFNRSEYLNSVIAVPGNRPSISLIPSWMDGESRKFQQEYPPSFLRKPDLAQAKALMAQVPEDQRKLTFLTFDGPTSRKRAEYFQAYFGKTLGLEILIEQQSVKQFYQKLNTGNFDFAAWGWLPDYNDILTYADLFASWNGNNVGAYRNPEYDDLIRVIQSSTGGARRFRAADRIQKIIYEDVVIIPTYEVSSAYLVSSRLKAMQRRLFGADPD